MSQCFPVRNSIFFLTKTQTKAWLSVPLAIKFKFAVRIYTNIFFHWATFNILSMYNVQFLERQKAKKRQASRLLQQKLIKIIGKSFDSVIFKLKSGFKEYMLKLWQSFKWIYRICVIITRSWFETVPFKIFWFLCTSNHVCIYWK